MAVAKCRRALQAGVQPLEVFVSDAHLHDPEVQAIVIDSGQVRLNRRSSLLTSSRRSRLETGPKASYWLRPNRN